MDHPELLKLYDKAIDLYSEAINLNPTNAILYGNRSQVKIQVTEFHAGTPLQGLLYIFLIFFYKKIIYKYMYICSISNFTIFYLNLC